VGPPETLPLPGRKNDRGRTFFKELRPLFGQEGETRKIFIDFQLRRARIFILPSYLFRD